LAAPLGGGAERGGGGRSAQPARGGVPGRGTRRGGSAPRLLEDLQSGGRRALSGAPSLQPRKEETRPRTYPAPGAAHQGRFPDGEPRLN
ncbi:unnamed protein product, partial [Ectocarpus sp. 12 AP-2014]